MSKINWFPGHMARAIREIQNTPIIDLIIEVVDARCIKTSHNDELTKIFNKPKLTIALKSDLSDVSSYDDVLIGSTFNKGFKKIVFNQIDKILSEKKNKFLSKGLLVPQFYIIVLGLPNVGKSSLIKFLSSGKKLLISNRPGVTKSKQLIKITDNYFLYDTPGVMVKKIDTDEDGYKLGLVNIISKDVLPKYDCVKWGYDYLIQYYFNYVSKFFAMTTKLSFDEFLDYACNKYKFKLPNNNNDIERALEYILNIFKEGKIGKINYEKE